MKKRNDSAADLNANAKAAGAKNNLDTAGWEKPMMKMIKDIWFTKRDIVSDGYDEAAYYLAERAKSYVSDGKDGKDSKTGSKDNQGKAGSKDNRLSVNVQAIPSGTKCWTWTVPEKWAVKQAWIKDDKGKKLLDLSEHPLHVMSYSLPKKGKVSREELLKHIHTREKRPNSIPFEFKYYERDWGFCMQHNRLKDFTSKDYEVLIDSEFTKGSLKVVDITIKGEVEDTIVLCAHLCHPCMVNDDLAGVVVGMELIRELLKTKNHYTFKFLFLPETIGSVAYLATNEALIPKIKYGLFIEMLANDNIHSLQLSRQGNTRLDRMARAVMKKKLSKFNEGAFRKVICNDEMVFNGPGVDKPMIAIARNPYPEYHTNDDNPKIASEERLSESKGLILEIVRMLDSDYYPKRTFKGPVFLSGYGLWVDWRTNKRLNENLEQIFIRFEGDKSVFDIAEELGMEYDETLSYVNKFLEKGLVKKTYRYEYEN